MKFPTATDWEGFKDHASTSNASSNDGRTDNVPPPKPLPTQIAVPSFDADTLLPPILRDYVMDCSTRLQVDAAFVAVPLVSSLGTVVGNRIGLRPRMNDNWIEYANAWCALVGRPSTLKTPSLSAGTAPLRKLEKIANERHDDDMTVWREQSAVAKVKLEFAKHEAKKAVSKGKEPDGRALVEGIALAEPECRRFTTQNATPEVLHKILTAKKNATGIMLFNDELTSLLAQLNDEARGKSLRAFLLAGWNGGTSVTVDRIGRGENMRVEKCCLSVCGGIQPGKLAPLVRGAVAESIEDDGLVQRIQLIVWPDFPEEYVSRDAVPDGPAYSAVMQLFEHIEATPGNGFAGALTDEESGDVFLRYTPEAAQVFDEWLVKETNDIRKLARENQISAAVESHWTKYRKLVVGLSLLWHLAEEIDQPAVSVACVNRALAWLPYLKEHALRVYGGGDNLTLTACKSVIDHIKSKALALL